MSPKLSVEPRDQQAPKQTSVTPAPGTSLSTAPNKQEAGIGQAALMRRTSAPASAVNL